MARWDAHAARLGMTWAALVRALLDESVSMPEVIVYGIRAVGTEEIRFVGSTVQTLERRRKAGYPGKLGEWLAGVQWEYVELERTTVTRAGEAEARWVAELGGHGMLFNAGGVPSGARAEVRFPVALAPEVHAKAVELATRDRRTLGAFVQIAVERLIEHAGQAGAVVETSPRVVKRSVGQVESNAEIIYWCSICGRDQRRTPSGMICRNGHGGADSVRSLAEAAHIRATYEREDPERISPDPRDEPMPPPPRRAGPRGSAGNPNSAFPQDEDDLDDVRV